MSAYVWFIVTGVDYLHGHREEFVQHAPTSSPPDPAVAHAALSELLPQLPGALQRLRAGWAEVRWGDADDASGPSYFFSFEATRAAGQFTITPVDPEP